jgi:hypothetical protein
MKDSVAGNLASRVIIARIKTVKYFPGESPYTPDLRVPRRVRFVNQVHTNLFPVERVGKSYAVKKTGVQNAVLFTLPAAEICRAAIGCLGYFSLDAAYWTRDHGDYSTFVL